MQSGAYSGGSLLAPLTLVVSSLQGGRVSVGALHSADHQDTIRPTSGCKANSHHPMGVSIRGASVFFTVDIQHDGSTSRCWACYSIRFYHFSLSSTPDFLINVIYHFQSPCPVVY